MRCRTKRECLQKNFCKKAKQLQHTISRYKYDSENLNFQRQFLHDWYNPRINGAIQKFRDHIAKMQTTALEDYDFIVERTDRFYARKRRKLCEELNQFSETLNTLHADKLDEVKKQEEFVAYLVAEIEQTNQDNDRYLERMGFLTMNELKQEKSRIADLYRNEMEKVDVDLNSKAEKLQSESSARIGEMEKDLNVQRQSVIRSIQSSLPPPNTDHLIAKISQVRDDLGSKREIIEKMKENNHKTLTEIKQRVVDYAKATNDQLSTNKREVVAMKNNITNERQAFTEKVKQMKEDQEKMQKLLDQNLSSKRKQLDELKRKNAMDLESIRLGSSSAIVELNKQLAEINSSLISARKNEEVRILNTENRRSLELEDLENQISTANGFKQMQLQAQTDANTERNNHIAEQDTLQEQFISKRETLRQKMQETLAKQKSKIQRSNSDYSKALKTQKETLQNLCREKQDATELHTKALSQLEESCDAEIKKLQDRFTSELLNLEQSLQHELLQLSETSDAILVARRKQHRESMQILVQNCETERNSHLEAIKSSANNDQMLAQISQEKQQEYRKLQSEMNEKTQVMPAQDVFKSMAAEYESIQQSLAHRQSSIQTEKESLIFHWNTEIESENERHKRCTTVKSSGRAREQVKLSYSKQIKEVMDSQSLEKHRLSEILEQETHYKLPDFDENEHTNFENEKNALENELSQVTKHHNDSIPAALLAFENETAPLRSELEIRTSSFNREKEELENAINHQESCFKKENSKLEEFLVSQRQLCFDESNAQKMKHSMKIDSALDRHRRQVADITQDLEHFQVELAKLLEAKNPEEAMELALRSKEEEYVLKLERLKVTLAEEHQARMELFEEQIQELIKQRNKFRNLCHTKAKYGRPCDIEQIERLQIVLHSKKIEHGNLEKDLAEYKIMYCNNTGKHLNRKSHSITDISLIQGLRKSNVAVA